MLIRIHSEDLFMMLCMAIGEQPSDATANASRAVDMFKYMMTDEAHVDMFETMDYQFIDSASEYKTVMLRYSGNIFALPQYALRISFDENDSPLDIINLDNTQIGTVCTATVEKVISDIDSYS